MRYFEKKRREWICDFIAKNGRINRSDIMKEFGISLPQATIDLRRLTSEFPQLVIYNHRSRQYEVPGFKAESREACANGCLYSRSMDQSYPRKCQKCGREESTP